MALRSQLPIRSKGALTEIQSTDGPAERLPKINPHRPDPQTLDEYALAIRDLAKQAEDCFVRIGLLLITAKARLDHGEFHNLITSQLPFGPRAAQMMMVAAQAIEDEIVPRSLAPMSYATVYQIAKLSDGERKTALEQGLIRPDVRRDEVMAFKRSLRAPVPVKSQPSMDSVDREGKIRLLQRLKTERDRLNMEIASLEADLGIS